MSDASLVQQGVTASQEHDRLRRYIAANIVGDNPPPLTAEARDLIRRILGSGTDYGDGEVWDAA